jgi:hypothetical protein
MIIAKFTSQAKSNNMEIDAKASFGKASMFKASAQYQAQGSLENATCEVLVIGGSSQNSAAGVTQLSFNGLLDLINKDAIPKVDAPGEPISYSVHFAADNSIAKVGQAGEYTIYEKILKKKYFNITLSDFTIVRQCTDFFPPDFTYYIEITDNDGNILWNDAIFNGVQRASRQKISLAINVPRDQVGVPDSPGSSITINAKLTAIKALTVVPVGRNGLTFSYPWLGMSQSWQTVDLGSGNCAATFTFRISPSD